MQDTPETAPEAPAPAQLVTLTRWERHETRAEIRTNRDVRRVLETEFDSLDDLLEKSFGCRLGNLNWAIVTEGDNAGALVAVASLPTRHPDPSAPPCVDALTLLTDGPIMRTYRLHKLRRATPADLDWPAVVKEVSLW